MIYTLIVSSNHLTDGRNALLQAEELIQQQNQINHIYFIFDGVYTANKYIEMPSDEFDLKQAWSDFASKHKVRLSICAASGFRRGITPETLASGFSMSSIGELVESCNAADKVLTA